MRRSCSWDAKWRVMLPIAPVPPVNHRQLIVMGRSFADKPNVTIERKSRPRKATTHKRGAQERSRDADERSLAVHAQIAMAYAPSHQDATE